MTDFNVGDKVRLNDKAIESGLWKRMIEMECFGVIISKGFGGRFTIRWGNGEVEKIGSQWLEIGVTPCARKKRSSGK